MFVSVHLSLTPLGQSGQAEIASDCGAASSGGCEDGFSGDPNRTQHQQTLNMYLVYHVWNEAKM